mgnify:CR=1 FL=1|tara:strand:+ start:36 stop:254 length:219 start_codon:yes stop_codon:yes gene_type:complete
MACKNCKGKDLQSISSHLQNKLLSKGKSLYEQGYDKTVGQITFTEKIILLLFAWIPIAIGYFAIIKFIVSIF